MPITINGNGTVTGISAGGLPDGCVDRDTLATAAKGSVLQYLYAQKTATQTLSSNTTWTDITDLSINITPKVSGNTLIFTLHARYGNDTSSGNGIRLIKDSTTVIGNSGGADNALGNVMYNIGGNRPYMDISHMWFDTSSGTSQVNYKIQAYKQSGSFQFNGRGGEANDGKYCQLTVMEVVV